MIFELKKKKKNSNKIVALDLKLSRDNPRLYCLYRLTCHQSQKKKYIQTVVNYVFKIHQSHLLPH